MREGLLAALDAIEQATGEKKVNAIGYCVGGTLLAVTLAYMAAKHDDRIDCATFFATQVDFTHAGDLKVFVDEEQISALEREMSERGYLEGTKMANAFNMLRSNDLIWPYVVNNYLKGKAPLPVRPALLELRCDPHAGGQPLVLSAQLLPREQALTKGEMVIGGVKLDLKKVKIPIYNLATREDHIAPAKSVFLGSKFFGGPVRFVLAGSGHIAGVVNPPARRSTSTGPAARPSAATSRTGSGKAKEHPGSWWPDWFDWIKAQDATEVPARARRRQASPLEDAPGSYVKVRD